MDISHLSKAKVVVALFDRSGPMGSGMIGYNPYSITEDEVQKLLDTGITRFENLHGRTLKIDVTGNRLNTWLFNLNYGDNAAEDALLGIENSGKEFSKLGRLHR